MQADSRQASACMMSHAKTKIIARCMHFLILHTPDVCMLDDTCI